MPHFICFIVFFYSSVYFHFINWGIFYSAADACKSFSVAGWGLPEKLYAGEIAKLLYSVTVHRMRPGKYQVHRIELFCFDKIMKLKNRWELSIHCTSCCPDLVYQFITRKIEIEGQTFATSDLFIISAILAMHRAVEKTTRKKDHSKIFTVEEAAQQLCAWRLLPEQHKSLSIEKGN